MKTFKSYIKIVTILSAIEWYIDSSVFHEFHKIFADPFDYFLLDDETGELRTAKPLNREALKDSTGVLTLEVKARELIDGMPGKGNLTESTAVATVTIRDVNDEPPTFNRREYNVEIPENVPNGTLLPHLDMTVKDPDSVSIDTREEILWNQVNEFGYERLLVGEGLGHSWTRSSTYQWSGVKSIWNRWN